MFGCLSTPAAFMVVEPKTMSYASSELVESTFAGPENEITSLDHKTTTSHLFSVVILVEENRLGSLVRSHKENAMYRWM